MTMEKQSFCEIKIDAVIDMCKTTLTRINEERETRNKKMIQVQMDKHKASYEKLSKFRRIFKFKQFKQFKPLTEEGAKDMARIDYAWGEFPSDYAWGDKDTCERMLDMATKAQAVGSKTICVTLSDHNAIN